MWHVVGHEAAVALLENSLKVDRLSHAYLFAGPDHVGKMTLALNLAQALNCEAAEPERPCASCTSCRRTAALTHSDVQVIEVGGRAEISIDQIREIERSATLKPFEGRNRVYIIDQAEKLSTEAANSLLKTLEEPPPHVQLLLLTANQRSLLPTVLSRCQRLDLGPLPVAVVEKALVDRWEVPPERASLLARLSQGCIGWAIEASGDDDMLSQRSMLLDRLRQLSTEGRAGRFAYASELANQFSKNRTAVSGVLNLWTSWWRDLMLTKEGCQDYTVNADHHDTLAGEADRYQTKGIKGFIDSLKDAAIALDQNSNPRLVLEVLMLNIPTAERD